MNLKELFNNDNGVSPVIGMILIISMVTVSIGIIYTSGVPFIDSAKHNTQLVSTKNSFTVLHNDILEVNNGPLAGAGIGRITRIDLGGGSMSVEPDNTKIQLNYASGMGPGNVTAIPGTITYSYKSRSVVYENGAVFSKYITHSNMEIEPQIYATNLGSGNTGLMVHLINITGSNSTVGSSGAGKIRTYLAGKGKSRSIDVDYVEITINSQNSDSWARYFNQTLSDAGLISGDHFNTTVGVGNMSVSINGAAGTGDIHLLIYEIIIEANAE